MTQAGRPIGEAATVAAEPLARIESLLAEILACQKAALRILAARERTGDATSENLLVALDAVFGEAEFSAARAIERARAEVGGVALRLAVARGVADVDAPGAARSLGKTLAVVAATGETFSGLRLLRLPGTGRKGARWRVCRVSAAETRGTETSGPWNRLSPPLR